ncbi:MAG: lytic transglycosylase domain-containing protein [Deltaproteobacteria bacterium]|nr:lytic transglycosylase domain-containing protein [Deltaproteobacteria bacterium]
MSYFEHQARLEATLPEIMPIEPEQIAPPSDPGPNFASLLSPTPEILDQVKNQTPEKPDFDKKAAVYEEMIQSAARRHSISPALIKAVIQAESRFNAQAVSSQGAVGLMQVLPSTARSLGVNSPHEPYNNINAGARYLKKLLIEYNDDEYLALAAYNCGPDAIRRYGNAMPPFRETKSFVAKVMLYYQSYIDS